MTSRMSSSTGFPHFLGLPAGLPIFLLGVWGRSVSLNTGTLFSFLCSRAHTVVSRKAMAFGWWAFKISALLSASSLNSAAGCLAPGAGWGSCLVRHCVLVTSQSKRKERRSGLTDIKGIVLCKWLVHGNIIPDINPQRTYTYYSRSQCKSSLCDFLQTSS